MPKLYDCFLYNNEIELLEMRLSLLGSIVDRFVIVCSRETFTGRSKAEVFPYESKTFIRYGGKIELIIIDKLEGESAWEKESYSRNRMNDGLVGLSNEDLVMISDIDEIPRPKLLNELKSSFSYEGLVVLCQDYFNFKFNYKLVHGLQAVWAGPVICRYKDLSSPQDSRDRRWSCFSGGASSLYNAGWHFSYLTIGNDVAEKLASFSHQEKEIQNRNDSIDILIESRQGFHDHLHPASVWAVVSIEDYDCKELSALVLGYQPYIAQGKVDDRGLLSNKIKLSTWKIYDHEYPKVLRWASMKELILEIVSRMIKRLNKWAA